MSHKFIKVLYSMCRNITMLRSGYVSGLEKSGAVRGEFTTTILDFDVHNSGNAKMVYFQGKNKEIPKSSSMVAR